MIAVPRPTADSRQAGQVPVGVLAAEQRAREADAELQRWRHGDLQWQAFHRLWTLNVNHASQAWRLRYRRPLAPYALGFLFRQPADPITPDTARVTVVRAATRVWLAGPESTDPIGLLSTLTQQVRARDPHTAWDLREEIANRCDPDMATDAVYAGLGLSSLDTPAGDFEQACRTAYTELDIPGVFLHMATGSTVLADQQVLVAERGAGSEHGRLTIHTYRALATPPLASPYPYSEVTLDALYQRPVHGPLLSWMWELDVALREADHARRSGGRRMPGGGGRHGPL